MRKYLLFLLLFVAFSCPFIFSQSGSTVVVGSTQTLCSGSITLGTSAITSGAKGNSATSSCSGLVTTDTIVLTPNVEAFGITGFVPSANGILTVSCWPTANTVNCEEANNTAGSITPSAITLNYRVVR